MAVAPDRYQPGGINYSGPGAGVIKPNGNYWIGSDGNSQGSRTPATDAPVTVVAGNAGSAKPVVATYTITRATGQSITLTAETDRAYLV